MPKGESKAARLASISPEERAKVLATLTPKQKAKLAFDWAFWARPKQMMPPGDWFVWQFLGGRGSGKTRMAAESIRKLALSRKVRIALIAPTVADVRDVMVEGESGLLAIHPEHERPNYEPSKRRLTWPNGSIATTYSADAPKRLRGPQHHYVWWDEPAACDDPEHIWNLFIPGVRLTPPGDRPRIILTTTPIPDQFFYNRLAEPTTVYTTASTWENENFVAPPLLEYLKTHYADTELGKQEIEGILLGQAPGALWKQDWIINNRSPRPSDHNTRKIIIAVDPSSSDRDSACECGIVIAALGADNNAYILKDESVKATPMEWVAKLGKLRTDWKADNIVYEANYGKGFIQDIFRLVDPKAIPFLKEVHASSDKATRASPVSALTQKGRVKFVGEHKALEMQLTTWIPGKGKSPDRLDALVWAVTDLLVVRPPARGFYQLEGYT